MMTVGLGSNSEQIVLNYGDENPSLVTSVKMKIAKPKKPERTPERKIPKNAKSISTDEKPVEKNEVVEEVDNTGLDEFDTNSLSNNEQGVKTPLALYMKSIRDIIEKNKFYPPIARRLRQEGVVKIRITINKTGKIEDAEIIEGKYPALKDAALKIVTERSSFPEFLKEIRQDRMKITIPINFEII